MVTEQWRPIPGYEGSYEVSDLGNVRSLRRVLVGADGIARRFAGMKMNPTYNKGYPFVHLPVLDPETGRTTGRRRNGFIHQLVLEAFVGPAPDGMEVRHLNGVKSDARLVNLAYGTRSENLKDRGRHGQDYNRLKTECPKGHPYSGWNLLINARGYRHCRACKYLDDNARRRRKYAEKKSQSANAA